MARQIRSLTAEQIRERQSAAELAVKTMGITFTVYAQGANIDPASERERRAFAKRIRANPRNYVAQPLISLSTCPTVCGSGIDPRHVDLRPFVLQGAKHYVTPGGLTRVALPKGSFVVNSSQGGGSKDTWIVDPVK